MKTNKIWIENITIPDGTDIAGTISPNLPISPKQPTQLYDFAHVAESRRLLRFLLQITFHLGDLFEPIEQIEPFEPIFKILTKLIIIFKV